MSVADQKGEGAGKDACYISASGATFPVTPPLWQSPDGTPLSLSAGAGLTRTDIVPGEFSLWRYAAAIRVDRARRVTLGEGLTPLVTAALPDARFA